MLYYGRTYGTPPIVHRSNPSLQFTPVPAALRSLAVVARFGARPCGRAAGAAAALAWPAPYQSTKTTTSSLIPGKRALGAVPCHRSESSCHGSKHASAAVAGGAVGAAPGA
ncbi:unnamed protein product [Prorocentrum cordatum]|uniref:Uncharacterized protein n=1 Tax=Prorocentrum cordatum TaxID=2364126 RepID=A0ABN9VXZ4_9DINO|nr:unnamed protein product [Polarella glacialis]